MLIFGWINLIFFFHYHSCLCMKAIIFPPVEDLQLWGENENGVFDIWVLFASRITYLLQWILCQVKKYNEWQGTSSLSLSNIGFFFFTGSTIFVQEILFYRFNEWFLMTLILIQILFFSLSLFIIFENNFYTFCSVNDRDWLRKKDIFT